MDLVIQTLQSVSYAIVNPTVSLMLLVVGILFYMRNKKIVFMQKMVMGEIVSSPLELTISQLVLGILGGVVGSVILTILGVTFYENSGIEFLFVVSIFILVYKPQFFNFTYSAAVLGVLSIFITLTNVGQGKFLNINITYLITLVSVITFVQGVLIIIDGKTGYLPVFTNRDNKILGGFALKRYWALPITFIVILLSSSPVVGQTVSPGNWWPIIKVKEMIPIIATSILTILPIYGIIGYDSVTFNRNKNKKAITSGVITILQGLLLLVVAQVAQLGLLMEFVAIILMLVLHKGNRYLEKKLEEKSLPIYFSDDEGICILEVLPKSTAFKQGVRSGDRVIEVDGVKPDSEKDVLSSLKNTCFTTILKIKSLKGEVKEYIISEKNKTQRFGVILVPKDARNREKYNVQEILDRIKTISK